MKKRILSLLLVATMLLTLLPMTVFANAPKEESKVYTWIIHDYAEENFESIRQGSTYYNLAGEKIVLDGIEVSFTDGNTPTRLYKNVSNTIELRIYKGGSITFNCPESRRIKKIEFFGTSKMELDSGSTGTYANPTEKDSTWTATDSDAKSVKFNAASGTTKFNKIIITYTVEKIAITNGSPESDSAKNHGYITVDKTSAAEGETVTVNVHPEDGYQLKSLTVVPAVLTFKAVYNTSGDANTLTFYYDAVDHSGEGTVYDNLPTAATQPNDWGYNSNRSKIKSVVIDESVKNYTGLTSTAFMFQGITKAESITGAEYLNVSNVTDMRYMFLNYGAQFKTLAVVPNVSNWNTDNATDMSYMFQNYGSTSTVLSVVPDVSKWNTSNVTNLANMFQSYGSASTVLNAVPDVSKWNTGKVTDMSYMFYGYGKSSKVLDAAPDTSGWNTGSVTSMKYMFQNYGDSSTVLTAVPNVSNWNTGSVTEMNCMFQHYGYKSTVLNAVPDVSNWNTSSVTNLANMFQDYGGSSTALTKVPDVSKWNTSKVKSFSVMFKNYGSCSAVLEFKLDLSGWSVESVTEKSTDMFIDAGAKATTWSVTIPAKTGKQANDSTHWYYGDGTDTEKYIAPATDRAFTVDAPVAPVTYMDWDDSQKKLVEKSATEAIEVTSETTTLDAGKFYVVKGEVSTAGLVVNGTTDNPTTIILADGATLNATSSDDNAGIGVASDKAFIITGQSGGTGNLIAYGCNGGAGIGGGYTSTGGAVTINGGTVTATGGSNGGAGIGGGANGIGGTVTINGGTVTATGSGTGIFGGAGIGGSYRDGGTVVINGGTVTATGKGAAAGIGGGYMSTGGAVTINGGTVTATGGYDVNYGGGAGIGGGVSGNGGTVTINGGTVTATGGYDMSAGGYGTTYGGNAIGTGYYGSNSGTVTFGGSFTVMAGDVAPGIETTTTAYASNHSAAYVKIEEKAAPASQPVKSPSRKLLANPSPAEPETITPEKQTDGTYQFTMPGYAVTITAEFEEIQYAELIADALAGRSDKSVPGVIDVAVDQLGNRTVKLLKNIDMGDKDVTVAENVFFDFNHFALTTTGKMTNNGVIILHQENADIVEDLLYKVPGNYAASEELKLPNDASPDYVIPAGTFMTSEVGTDPAYQELSFASGDDMLVWNKDVTAGVQIDVAYSLTLGGDILGAKGDNVKPTKATATNVALNDNIAIGGNNGEGEASLVIESLPADDLFPETVGTFTANGKKITLNKSGKLVISSNITFDESVLVSGAEDMVIAKTENKTDGTVTYFLNTPHAHNPVLVNGQAATESTSGWKDYYECECGDCFEDATGLIPIEDLTAWKSSTGNGYIAPLVHSITPVNGQDATDTEAGFKAYYECKNCNKYYEDATGLIEISNIDEWKAEGGAGYLAPLHGTDNDHDHICDYCDRQVSECKDEDNDHKCDICGKQISEHNAILVEGTAATLQSAGHKSYYKCDICGKFFEDATCKVEITNLDAWKAQGGAGYIAKLEEEPKSPQTGDNSHMTLWVMLMALSSMGLCACLVLGKKRKNVQ